MKDYIKDIKFNEDKTEITIKAEIDFKGDRKQKIKYHTTDVMQWLEKNKNVKILRVIQPSTLSNTNLNQLKAEWKFEIENKNNFDKLVENIKEAGEIRKEESKSEEAWIFNDRIHINEEKLITSYPIIVEEENIEKQYEKNVISQEVKKEKKIRKKVLS